MALKAILILATISSACSQTQSHCSAYEDGTNDGRDCSCADRFYEECAEPSTDAQLPVANLEECQSLCSDWSGCEWFIFDRSGAQDFNCKMFSTGQDSMADYLSSCNTVGGPRMGSPCSFPFVYPDCSENVKPIELCCHKTSLKSFS